MPQLDVPGASLAYEVDGRASDPALLLIHAGIATRRMWDPQVASLAADHNVIRFDTRGFGDTTAEDVPFSNRADAIAVLDHLGVASATIIGCSRGGSIAIDLALEHPDRVAGLVTIGSGPSGFPELELTEREDELFDRLDTLDAAREWEQLARAEVELWAFGPTRDMSGLDPQFVSLAYELNAENIRHAEAAPTPIPLEPPAYDRVTDIAVPALITVGDHDLSPTLAQYEYLVTRIPGADGRRFPDAAHLPSVERPEEFTRILVRWLADHGL